MLGLLAFLEFNTLMLCVNTQEYDYLMTRIKVKFCGVATLKLPYGFVTSDGRPNDRH